jgi:hypothetical protein
MEHDSANKMGSREVTDVFLRRNQGWQAIASHPSRLPGEATTATENKEK